MGFYRPLCIFMDSHGSLRVLIGPYESIWVVIDPYMSLVVHMGSYWFLWVFMCPFILHRSVCVYMGLYGSLLALMFRYGSL